MEKLELIKRLMKERKPYYDQIEHHIDTDNKTVKQVAEEVIEIWKSDHEPL